MNSMVKREEFAEVVKVDKLSKLDLNLFLVFDAIYRERSLTRAAENLHITQPAASNALNRLRVALEDPLFERKSGTMVPTTFARGIAKEVRHGLAVFRAAASRDVQFDPGSSTAVIKLSMNDLVQRLMLPVLLSYIAKNSPGVSLECYYTHRTELARDLAAGRIDLGVDVPAVSGDSVLSERLYTEPYICASRVGHPDLNDSLSLSEYLGMEHIQVSTRQRGLAYEDIALQRLGVSRKIKIRLPHFHVAPYLVHSTNMLLTAPVSVLQGSGLTTYRLPFELAPLQWRIYRHEDSREDPAVQWIVGVMKQLAPQLTSNFAGASYELASNH